MDKSIINRKGEIFVMQKLMENGWTILPMEESDLIFEGYGRKIKIRVKTNEKIKKVIGNFGDIDYLIFTDLQDLWIIPAELLNNSGDDPKKTVNKLKNAFSLLFHQKTRLFAEVNDFGVKFGELNTTSAFFEQYCQKNTPYAGSFRICNIV